MPSNRFGIAAALDLAWVSGQNVCGRAQRSAWYCTDSNGRTYDGEPQPNLDNNDVKPGLTLATSRMLLSYERRLGGSFWGLARVGYAFGGAPRPAFGSAFLPWHGELRLSARQPGPVGLDWIWFGGFGLMEVDAEVPVVVVEIPCGDGGTRCVRHLRAFHRSGLAFVAAGAAAERCLDERSCIQFSLRSSLTFGRPSLVFSPEVGYSFAF